MRTIKREFHQLVIIRSMDESPNFIRARYQFDGITEERTYMYRDEILYHITNSEFYPDKAVFTYVEATVADQEAVLEQMKKGGSYTSRKGRV